MARRSGRATAAAVVTALLVGCTVGSGDLASETREVTGFTAIDLQGSGEVLVTVDGTESLTIEAEDNIIPLLRTEVRGGVLELALRPRARPTEDVVFRVTAETIDALEVSGSGGMSATAIEGGDLAVAVSGSGAVDVDGVTAGAVSARVSGSGAIALTDIAATTVDVQISGSGAIDVAGVADRLDATVTGSGDLGAEELVVDDAEVTVSGSGSALVNATATLDVSLTGSGDVEYVGDPSVTVESSGSGDVSPR